MKATYTDWRHEFETDYERWELTSEIGAINIVRSTLEDPDEDEANEALTREIIDSIGLDTEALEELDASEIEDSLREQEFGMPMMNFRYPLETSVTDEQAVRVALETSCAVVQDTQTEEYFLVLTGGGMDLSQSIAYAYYLLSERIPFESALDIATQYGLNVSGDRWKNVYHHVVKSLEAGRAQADRAIDQWHDEYNRAESEGKLE